MQKEKIEIYTVDYCPYCKKALMFLSEHDFEFERHRIDDNEDAMREALAQEYRMSEEVTVPQIIVDGRRIGGYTDMVALYEKGEFPNKK